jgi:conjugal transfer pilus assembly protein TraF
MKIISCVLLVMCCALHAHAQSAFDRQCWNRTQCGWHFYDDPPQIDKTKPDIKTIIPTASVRNPKLVAAEKFNQEMKDALTIAVYDPSPENVLAWSKMKTRLVSNADTMSNVHQRLMWANPEMDFSVTGRPTSQVGMATFDGERAKNRRQTVSKLSRTHVLYYFFRSDCPHCRAFSPMLKAFAQATEMRVFAVSLDGQPLPDYPDAQADNGIAEVLKVAAVPAVFIADPAAGTITPIGYGAMSEEQLFERLDLVAKPPDQNAAAATPIRSLRDGSKVAQSDMNTQRKTP